MRFGVRLPGPFWVSFGGRRRYRPKRRRSGAPVWAWILLGLSVLATVIRYPLLLIPAAIVGTFLVVSARARR